MSIRVECDDCGATFNVKDAAAGKKMRCRSCDADIHIPDAPAIRGAKSVRVGTSSGGSRRTSDDDLHLEDFDIGGGKKSRRSGSSGSSRSERPQRSRSQSSRPAGSSQRSRRRRDDDDGWGNDSQRNSSGMPLWIPLVSVFGGVAVVSLIAVLLLSGDDEVVEEKKEDDDAVVSRVDPALEAQKAVERMRIEADKRRMEAEKQRILAQAERDEQRIKEQFDNLNRNAGNPNFVPDPAAGPNQGPNGFAGPGGMNNPGRGFGPPPGFPGGNGNPFGRPPGFPGVPGGQNGPGMRNPANPGNNAIPNPKPFDPNQKPAGEIGSAMINAARVIKWDVAADPHPNGRPKYKTTISEKLDSSAGGVIPAQTSRFVAVGSWNFSSRSTVLYDLVRGKPAGQLSGEMRLRDPVALSPEGTYFAGNARSGGDRPNGANVEVYSFKGQNLVSTATVADTSHSIKLLTFLGDDRLAVISGTFSESRLTLVDVTTGNTLQQTEFDRNNTILLPSVCVSPGGKYFAFLTASGDDLKLNVYDTESLELVGDVSMPTTNQMTFGRWTAAGMAFSEDGTKLATIINRHFEPGLIVLDATTGKEIETHFDKNGDLPKTLRGIASNKAPIAMRWLPGTSTIMTTGRYLVETETGKITWDLGDPGQFFGGNRTILDATHVLSILRDGGSRFIKVDVIPAVAKAANAGVAKPDRNIAAIPKRNPLPNRNDPRPRPEPNGEEKTEPVAVDVANARTVELPGAELDWNVKVPALPESLTDEVPPPLPLSGSGAVNVKFSSPQSAKAVVLHGLSKRYRPFWEKQTEEGRTWLERYNLTSLRTEGQIDVPKDSQLLDASPSGKVAITRPGDESATISVWNLETGEKRADLIPFPDHPGRVVQKGNIVHHAHLVDDDHLVVHNQATGRLRLIDLDGNGVTWKLDAQATTPIFMTPDRKHVGLFEGNRILFLNATGGTFAGELPVPADTQGANISPWQIAFSHDGNQLAIQMKAGNAGYALMHWDLRAGGYISEMDFGYRSLRKIAWVDNKHLLALGAGWGTYLLDLDRHAVLWRYRFNGGDLFPGPDRRQWIVVTGRNNERYLSALDFSDPDVFQQADDQYPETMLAVAKAGDAMAVDTSGVNLPGGQGGDFDKLRESLSTKLQENGLQVQNGAPLTLKMSTRETKSESRQYRVERYKVQTWNGMAVGPRTNRTESTVNVDVKTYELKLALTNAQGEEVWTDFRYITSGGIGGGFGFGFEEFVDPSVSADQWAKDKSRNNQKGSMMGALMSMNVPRVFHRKILDDKGMLGMGERSVDFPGIIRSSDPKVREARKYAAKLFGRGGREYVFRQAAEVLSRPEEEWEDELKWNDWLERPFVTGVRIGFGIEMTGTKTKGENYVLNPGPATVETGDELEKGYGALGKILADGLYSRVDNGQFGNWPSFRDSRHEGLTVLGRGHRKDLLDLAESSGIDVLVVIRHGLDSQRGARSVRETVGVTIFDVQRKKSVWGSKTRTTKQIQTERQEGNDPLQAMAEDTLNQLDAELTLTPFPIPRSKAQNRMGVLSSESVANPALAVLESLFYLKNNLSSEPKVRPVVQKLSDSLDGRAFLEGDAETRAKLVETWLPKWVTMTEDE